MRRSLIFTLNRRVRAWLGLGRAVVPRVQAGRAPGPFPPDLPLFTHVDVAPSRNHIERRQNENSINTQDKEDVGHDAHPQR